MADALAKPVNTPLVFLEAPSSGNAPQNIRYNDTNNVRANAMPDAVENAVTAMRERAQLIAQKAQLIAEEVASTPLGLRVAFALNNIVAVYQERGGHGLGDPTADDAEELLARLHNVSWKGMTRGEVQRAVDVFHSFMMDVWVCPPAFLDFLVPAWVGASTFAVQAPTRQQQTAQAAPEAVSDGSSPVSTNLLAYFALSAGQSTAVGDNSNPIADLPVGSIGGAFMAHSWWVILHRPRTTVNCSG